MADIKILKPGLFTSIQDRGRVGYQEFGMPVSGAMDIFSLRMANILVGNNEYEAGLECTFLGPELEFNYECIIAITGGDMAPTINGSPIGMWTAIHIKRGDILSLNSAKAGFRSYIAFSGGIDVAPIMGSKSTYMTAGIGGLNGNKLIKDDEFNIGKNNSSVKEFINREVPKELIPNYSKEFDIRVVLGPQSEYFSNDEINKFLNSEYIISEDSNRMGYRLIGEKIRVKDKADIISDGIMMGSIQITGEGLPIIMMADRQTTGGYTKIATVISTDLPLLAQAKPGDKLNFLEINIDEAQRILRDYELRINNIKEQMHSKKEVVLDSIDYRITIDSIVYKLNIREV